MGAIQVKMSCVGCGAVGIWHATSALAVKQIKTATYTCPDCIRRQSGAEIAAAVS